VRISVRRPVGHDRTGIDADDAHPSRGAVPPIARVNAISEAFPDEPAA
jgi:hypothetical protein